MENTNLIKHNNAPSLKDSNTLLFILSAIVIGVFGLVFANFEIEAFFPGLSILIILLYYSYKSNDFWVLTSIMILPFMLLSRDSEMKVSELVATAYLLGGIFLYFIKHHLVEREKLIENWGDLLLVMFLLFASTNAIIAYLNAVDIVDWLRGYLVIILYLYYFPIRKYLKKSENINLFLIAFCICIIAICLHHLNYIVFNVVRATFAYQLESSLRINLTLISLSIFVCLNFVFDVKSKLLKLLLAGTLLLSTASVITSFARATWITVFALLLLALVLLTRKQRIRIAIGAFVALLALVIAFPKTISKADIYIKLLNKKFISSTQGKKDKSVRARFFEYEGVLKEVEQHPISGCGINKKFRYKNILSNSTTTIQIFTHNSFLHFWYMFGIPTTLCMIGYLLLMSIKSFYLFLIAKNMNILQKKIAFITFCGFVIVILHSIVSPQLNNLESIFALVLSNAMLNKDLLLSLKN